MLEITIRFPEKADSEKLNETICSFFQGSKIFAENDIIVGPIYEGWHSNKKSYYFKITFVDESIERTVDIEAGELTVMGLKKIWAFADDSEKVMSSIK